jgi:hypothetical protein
VLPWSWAVRGCERRYGNCGWAPVARGGIFLVDGDCEKKTANFFEGVFGTKKIKKNKKLFSLNWSHLWTVAPESISVNWKNSWTRAEEQ